MNKEKAHAIQLASKSVLNLTVLDSDMSPVNIKNALEQYVAGGPVDIEQVDIADYVLHHVEHTMLSGSLEFNLWYEPTGWILTGDYDYSDPDDSDAPDKHANLKTTVPITTKHDLFMKLERFVVIIPHEHDNNSTTSDGIFIEYYTTRDRIN